MSSESIRLKYDGLILADHYMDVADLAPALLSISELCKAANRKFNGDRTSVKVLISANVEQHCVQYDLQLVQSLWQQAQAVLDTADIKSAKEILEWLDLLKAGGAVLGLLGALGFVRNRRIRKAEQIQSASGPAVQITVHGDGNNVALVAPQAYELLKESAAVRSEKKIIEPILKDGYDTIEGESKGTVVSRITKADAEAIIQYVPSEKSADDSNEPQSVTAWIQVYSPDFDTTSKHWQFTFGLHTPCMVGY